MSKRIFSPEQVSEILKNANVARCSEKSITYHKDFKIESLRRYQQEGLSASRIFEEAGFNVALIGRETPMECVKRWRKTLKKKGVDSFSKEQRGGPGRRQGLKSLTDKEKLRYYEAQVAYLKAENAFLAKLRKQRLN